MKTHAHLDAWSQLQGPALDALHPAWSEHDLQPAGRDRQAIGLTRTEHRLSPWLMGLSLVETHENAFEFVVPAHGLCLISLVQKGGVSPVGHTVRASSSGQPRSSPAWMAWGPQSRASAFVAAPYSCCLTLMLRARVLPLALGCDAAVLRDKQLGETDVQQILVSVLMQLEPPGPDALQQRRCAALLRERADLRHFMEHLARGQGVHQAAIQQGKTMRQLQRLCARQVGLPPAMLARLFRLHRCTAEVLVPADPGAESGAHQALRSGFFDQAHMARDYRLLAGAPPRGLTQERSWALRAGADTLSLAFLMDS